MQSSCWKIISDIGEDKSLADDLNREQGIVSSRVALLLRSAEIKPLFRRFVLLELFFCLLYLLKCGGVVERLDGLLL
jgi:hypothetical protein